MRHQPGNDDKNKTLHQNTMIRKDVQLIVSLKLHFAKFTTKRPTAEMTWRGTNTRKLKFNRSRR